VTVNPDLRRCLRIGQDILVNGLSVPISDKDVENRYGPMVQCMKDTGPTTKLMVKVD